MSKHRNTFSENFTTFFPNPGKIENMSEFERWGILDDHLLEII